MNRLHYYILILGICLSPFLSPAQNTFIPLGGPTGAVIYAMEVCANGTIYLSTGRSIYRSNDNGNSWQLLDKGFGSSTFPFSALEAFPSGDAYVLRQGSVFHCAANSDTWQQLVFPPFFLPEMIAQDAQGRLLVGNGDELLRSPDGQNFDQLLTGNENLRPSSAASFKNQSTLVVSLLGLDWKLYQLPSSTPGTPILLLSGNNFFNQLRINPNNDAIFIADKKTAKRSVDFGASWTDLILTPGASQQPEIKRFHFLANGAILALTDAGVFTSVNGGQDWTPNTSDFFRNPNTFRFEEAPGGAWFAASINCNEPFLNRSFDQGATWENLIDKFVHPVVFQIVKTPAGRLYAQTCRNYDTFEESVDDGQNWSELIIQNQPIHNLTQTTSGILFAATKTQELYRSSDGGLSWQNIPSPTNPMSIRALKSSIHNDRVYATSTNMLYRTDDLGQNWTLLGNGGPDLYGFSDHPNGDAFWTGSGESLKKYSADQHKILFDYIPTLSPVFTHVTHAGDLYFTSIDPVTAVYKSSDGGQSYQVLPQTPGPISAGDITSNANGDIFIGGWTHIWTTKDDGLHWESVGPGLPIKSALLSLYMAPDQVLYATFAEDAVYRTQEATAGSGIIQGLVWLDANDNCHLDAGEKPLRALQVQATSATGSYANFSRFDGQYAIAVPQGDFSVHASAPNALFESCFTDVPVSISMSGDTDIANFPMRPTASCPYLSVNLSTPTALRRCFDNTYFVQYCNAGTATAMGAYLEVSLDSMLLLQTASLPIAAQNGNTYTFNLGDIEAGDCGLLTLTLKVSCDAALGQEHCVNAHIYPDQLCLPQLPQMAVANECQMNIGAFDPNDKTAFVNGRQAPGRVQPGEAIEYLIRFQNTGTDTAFQVVVEDKITSFLDLSTLEVLLASHPYRLEIGAPGRTLRFVFENIMLPDSNINATASHGFVKFRIGQKAALPLGTVINNFADIHFDSNDPIRTNTSSLVVDKETATKAPQFVGKVDVFPNPFEEATEFRIQHPSPGPFVLQIVDALGRLRLQEQFSGTAFRLQRNDWPAGIYFFSISTGQNLVGTGKIVVR